MHKNMYDEREAMIDVIIGQNLKKVRREKGYSRTALGDETGITQQQIQKYETGVNRVSAAKLFLFAELFKKDVQIFYNGVVPDDKKAVPEDKKPVYVHCSACGHEWVAFYAPIEVSKLLKTQPKACPKCHASAKIYIGKKGDK